MSRMSEIELKELLARNPQLSISGHPRQGNDSIGMVRRTTECKPDAAPVKSLLAQPAYTTKPKHRKYRNMRVTVMDNGSVVFEAECTAAGLPFLKGKLLFDSEKEYRRYLELKKLESAGRITGLELQKVLTIQCAFRTVSGESVRAIEYKADFIYTLQDGTVVVEDVKAKDNKTGRILATQVFLLKWKMLKCRYPEYRFCIES